MIDLHSHILPGLDDGASSMTESLAMAKSAVQDGIQVIYATPHELHPQFDYQLDELYKQFEELNAQLIQEEVPLEVRLGQELRISGDLVERLNSKEALTLGNGGQYVLIEFPSDHVPEYAQRLLFDVQVAGYKPIIAHPERNKEIMQKPELMYKLIRDGNLAQVTAASVAGNFGNKIQEFSFDLIEANLAHFIASDAHNTNTRGFVMTKAWESIRREFGLETVYYLRENAEILAEGGQVISDEPIRIKQKKKKKLFKFF
ncbi:tyrosine-protein phosphatase [Piscibacillus sp. B03]|uniref:tyrosine-protein phosphatase n=1 Tax=Piscibacillus sp. B03 TaxID=3457430 RepID=UPI003FCC590D